MTRVLYLDRYHLGDPLFLSGLARDLAAAALPTVVVHGAAEGGERALEAEGRFPRWEGDTLAVGSEAEAATVERAARALNREITHALNDAGVAAVRLDGASRGLFSRDAGGGVRLGETAWLVELLRQGVTPVLAALAPSAHPAEGALREVSGGALAGALAAALPGGVAVVLARRPLPDGLAGAPDDAFGDAAAARAAEASGAEVRAVTRAALRGGGGASAPNNAASVSK